MFLQHFLVTSSALCHLQCLHSLFPHHNSYLPARSPATSLPHLHILASPQQLPLQSCIIPPTLFNRFLALSIPFTSSQAFYMPFAAPSHAPRQPLHVARLHIHALQRPLPRRNLAEGKGGETSESFWVRWDAEVTKLSEQRRLFFASGSIEQVS